MAIKKSSVRGRQANIDPHISRAKANRLYHDTLARYADRKKLRPQEKSAITRTLNRLDKLQKNLGKLVEDRASLIPVTGRDLKNARKNKLTLGGFNVVGINAAADSRTKLRVYSDGRIKSAPQGPKGKTRAWRFEPVIWRFEKQSIKGAFTADKIAERFEKKARQIFERSAKAQKKLPKKRRHKPRIYLKTRIAVMYRLGGFDDAEITRHEVERWVNNYVVQQNKFFDDELGDTNWDWVEDALWGVAWHD